MVGFNKLPHQLHLPPIFGSFPQIGVGLRTVFRMGEKENLDEAESIKQALRDRKASSMASLKRSVTPLMLWWSQVSKYVYFFFGCIVCSLVAWWFQHEVDALDRDLNVYEVKLWRILRNFAALELLYFLCLVFFSRFMAIVWALMFGKQFVFYFYTNSVFNYLHILALIVIVRITFDDAMVGMDADVAFTAQKCLLIATWAVMLLMVRDLVLRYIMYQIKYHNVMPRVANSRRRLTIVGLLALSEREETSRRKRQQRRAADAHASHSAVIGFSSSPATVTDTWSSRMYTYIKYIVRATAQSSMVPIPSPNFADHENDVMAMIDQIEEGDDEPAAADSSTTTSAATSPRNAEIQSSLQTSSQVADSGRSGDVSLDTSLSSCEHVLLLPVVDMDLDDQATETTGESSSSSSSSTKSQETATEENASAKSSKPQPLAMHLVNPSPTDLLLAQRALDTSIAIYENLHSQSGPTPTQQLEIADMCRREPNMSQNEARDAVCAYVSYNDFCRYLSDEDGHPDEALATESFALFVHEIADLKIGAVVKKLPAHIRATRLRRTDIEHELYEHYVEANRLLSSLSDVEGLFDVIRQCLNIVWGLAVIFIALVSNNIGIQGLWLSSSAIILSMSFAFGNSLKNLLESILFLTVSRPFDYGDRIRIGETSGPSYWVESISLMHTRFRHTMKEIVYIPNAVLAQQRIVNLSRQENTVMEICFDVDFYTTAEQLEAFEDGLKQYTEDHNTAWKPGAKVMVYSFKEHAAMTLGIWVEHRRNLTFGGIVFGDKSLMLQHMRDSMSRLKIGYRLTEQPVRMSGGFSGIGGDAGGVGAVNSTTIADAALPASVAAAGQAPPPATDAAAKKSL